MMKRIYFLLAFFIGVVVMDLAAQCSIGSCVSIDCGMLNASFMPEEGPLYCDGELITLINTSDAGFDYFVVDWSGGAIDTFYNYSSLSHAFVVSDDELCDPLGVVNKSICFIAVANCDEGISCQSGSLSIGIRIRPLSFFELPDPIIVGEAFSLQDFSCNADTYLIDYGDGTTSMDINASHTYATEGTYDLSLAVQNECGIDTYAQPVEVTAENAFEFDITVTGASTEIQNDTIIIFNTAGTPLVFSAAVENAITSNWSFDIVNLSISQEIDGLMVNASISGTGFLMLSLTVTTPEGTATVTQVFEIRNSLNNQPPTFVVPPSLQLTCGSATEPTATGEPTEVMDDNDDNPVISFLDEVVNTDCPHRFIIVRAWRVTDLDGLFTEANQIITVSDEEPPTFTLPTQLEFSNGEDINDFNVTGMPANLADNCSSPDSLTVTFVGDEYIVEPGEDCLFSFVRTWEVTDECGNSREVEQIITVNDPFNLSASVSDPPQCPNDTMTTIALDIISNTDVTIDWNIDVYDGSITLTNLGVGTYSVTVTNDFGCADSLTQTLTTEDIEEPVFVSCPSDTTILVTDESTAALAAWSSPILADNCSPAAGITLLNNGYPNNNTILFLGQEEEIAYWGMDEAGNLSDTCRFRVRLENRDELGFHFADEDWTLEGNLLIMPVRATDFVDVLAYQMTLGVTAIESVDSLRLRTANFGELSWETYDDARLGVLWLSEDGLPQTLDDTTTLFYVEAYLNANFSDCLNFEWTNDVILPVLVLGDGTEREARYLSGEFCGTNDLTISGRLLSRFGEALEAIEVIADGAATAFSTDSGNYTLDVPWGISGELGPSYDEDHLNGVNVADFVMIRNHILGLQTFTLPEEYISADTDGSKKLGLIDLIAIQRLLLGYDTAFVALPSWQFIPNSVPLMLSAAIDSVPDYRTHIEYEMLTQSLLNQDFTGLKTGDVNGTADAARENPIAESQATVTITSNNGLSHLAFSGLGEEAAYQLTLQIADPAKWVLLEDQSWAAEESAYAYDEDSGILKLFFGRTTANKRLVSWPKITFADRFDSRAELKISKTDFTDNLAADDDTRLTSVRLNVRQALVSSTTNLAPEVNLSLAPNPFTKVLTLEGELAVGGPVKVTISATNGQVLGRLQRTLSAGAFRWEITNWADLPAGLYQLQLRGTDFLLTHQLIKH